MADNHRYQSANGQKIHRLVVNQRLPSNNGNPVRFSVRILRPQGQTVSSAPPFVAPTSSGKRRFTTPPSATVPQERESSVHAVKRMKTNDNTDQKTQYQQAILRLQTWIRGINKARSSEEALSSAPEQSSTDSSSVERLHLLDKQMPTIAKTPDENNNNINGHSTTVEKISGDNPLCSNQIGDDEVILLSDSDPCRWSSFLIDDSDEKPTTPVVLPSTTTEQIVERQVEDMNEKSTVLVNEPDATSTKRKEELKCAEQQLTSDDHPQELSSDWIVEHDTTNADQISQLTNVAKKMSKATTDESKMAHINTIVTTIKEQQMQLMKLRTELMVMLHEDPKSNLSDTDQDTLMKFINQPITSGCWLCSGKTHTEVSTQCVDIDQQ